MIIKMTHTTVEIDDCDQDLNGYKWHMSNNGYACRFNKITGTSNIFLHREILKRILGRDLEKNEVTDHINRNRLDNRRNNLRVCTRGQNLLNNSPFNTSGYKGVYTSGKGFVARITSRGVSNYLGYFTDKRVAAIAYNEAAKDMHGEFGYLNDVS